VLVVGRGDGLQGPSENTGRIVPDGYGVRAQVPAVSLYTVTSGPGRW
jgi:hypothetical protein